MEISQSSAGMAAKWGGRIASTLAVVLLCTRFGGLFSIEPGNISAFWPANAALFALTFPMPAPMRRLALLLAVPTYAAAELWIGYPILNSFAYGIANVAEVAALLSLLRLARADTLSLDNLKDLFTLLGLATLASPLGGLIGAAAAAQAGAPFGPVFLRWSLADFFGYCLVAPLMLAWPRRHLHLRFHQPGRVVEFSVMLVVLLGVTTLSSGLGGVSAPLGAQFLPLPLLLWAALRFGPPGGAIATFVVACIAFFSTAHGTGLFAVGAPTDNVASLQMFFASVVVSVMTIACLSAERRQSEADLQQERRTLEERVRSRTRDLEEARAAAESATHAKSEFLANMSHEIRTPLNAILGMTALALERDLSSRERPYVEKANMAAKSLLGVINDILDFSKIEAGMLAIEAVPFDLRDVLDSVADVVALQAHEKGLEVVLSLPVDLPTALVGDASRLRQVLLNLGNNAAKFTQRGEIVLSVRVQEHTEVSVLLRFEVIDTGIGLDAQQQRLIFDAFTQADTSTTRRYGGTGLGLAISSRLAALMGGSLDVCSEPGRGACFGLSVPFALPPGADASPKMGGLGNRRLLIVDDNAAARQALAAMAVSLGLEATAAAEVTEALRCIAEADTAGKRHDLLLLDWQLPGTDGVDALRWLAGASGSKRLPAVLMLPAFLREDVQRRLEQARVDVGAMLTKPVSPWALHDACTRVLGGAVPRAPRIDRREDTMARLREQLRGARVLLVEDNPINRELAVELLERADVAVTVANDGQEALDRLEGERFDAVLMDCQMPVLDGYAATRALRSRPALRELPVIAMTANAMVGDREKVLEAGMNDHVAKPIVFEQLFATLARWIRMPAQPRQPTIDERAGLANAGGNEALYRRLLAMFLRNEADFDKRFFAALAAADIDAATRAAHDLKNEADTLGMAALRRTAVELERACRSGAPSAAIEALARAVSSQLAPVISELQARLVEPN